ncbi:MAG TPA: hypothetical protein VHB79_06810 [Polyangiaceae bacterium]|nr:hypothetical protein [Polyangiaceae bacterium]
MRRLRLGLLGIALALSGCVQQAMLENDVRSAIWKSRTLSTASDLSLAHAALSAQLVELEALYQRDHHDERIQHLLVDGYAMMARGFVELRYLDAVSQGDTARADYERGLREDAQSRERYYIQLLDSPSVRLHGAGPKQPGSLDAAFADAERACGQHDRTSYEAELNRLLAGQSDSPEQRLHQALVHALASAWLRPRVAERCRFPASP